MTDKDVLLEKYLLEKIATMKRFEYSEYSSLGKELKAQNDIEQKQHQNLDDTFRFDKIIKKEEPAWKRYNSKYIFTNIEEIITPSEKRDEILNKLRRLL